MQAIALSSDATKGNDTAQPVKDSFLEAPYNVSHPSSRCPNRQSRGGRMLPHKFKTTSRNQIRDGVYVTISTCIHCGGKVRGTEDYNVLAGVFTL